MRTAIILPAAQADIDDTAEYIAQDSLAAGIALLEATATTLQDVVDMPGIGREREDLAHERLAGIRSVAIKGFANWLVFYRTIENGIEVIRVLHGARDLETLFRDGD